MIVRQVLALFLVPTLLPALVSARQPQPPHPAPSVFGYANFATEAKIESRFLAVPSPQSAGEDLQILTAAPHLAATPEDYNTAQYVAAKFRAAGLQTEIVPYRVLIDWPRVVSVQAYAPNGHLLMSGPTREHVKGDPYGDDPRIVMPYNSSSGSGDVTAGVVYANYGRLQDFNALAARHIDVRGKIVICRYGAIFRGVKVYLAEQRGAIGVLLYSDPQESGYYQGKTWPDGPWRPATAVQRGSVQYAFKYPGDPETPSFASTLNLPDSARKSPYGDQPRIISIPLSYHDAAPILKALQGPAAPESWQGALPFTYHLGPGGVKVHLVSRQDYQRRVIWDVIGKVQGSQYPRHLVIVGNHRDAWTFGASDPSSGTAAMLEAVRGVGVLLKSGWRPRRSILFCSWDGEEEGLMGSTEWVEQNAAVLKNAVAYFNVDVGVTGPSFSAFAAPSLKQFVREVARSVPSPLGGTVYDHWAQDGLLNNTGAGPQTRQVSIGDLGSGSDFTPFFQHAGVPSTDVSSNGPYGVYHSAFDDFAWYTREADPHFLYLQEMARVLGLEALHMADADALPYDYVAYARSIAGYLDAARRKAPAHGLALDFAPVVAAAARFAAAAQRAHELQARAVGNLAGLNAALRQAEADFLDPAGLSGRPWYKHVIYAPGFYTGYAPAVLPGVHTAISTGNASQAAEQLLLLARALDRATQTLNSAP